MSKKNINQLQIDQKDLADTSVEELLFTAIGRKRRGVVRMQYIHRSQFNENKIRTLASIISYKFYREMESVDHMIDDRPTVDDLLGADLPWTGLVQSKNEVLDERYKIEGYIRSLIQVGDFVFQIRDLKDGSPYADGLVVLNIETDPETGEVDVTTSTGLKQIEVVEMFQGYPDALLSLKNHLKEIGYVQVRSDKMQMALLGDNGSDNISTIDIHLVGTTKTRDNQS